MYSVSVPGKIILFGEWAVVEGGMGIATALDCRLKIHVEATDGRGVTYVGEGGAPAHGYRMDMIHLPKGVAVKPYVRDVEDVYFVLDGAITAGWVQDGEIVERRLGTRDLLFNPAGRPHYFRNDGVTDAQFTMVVGSGGPESVSFEAA